MSRRLYRILMRLLPARFRRDCGADMERLFTERVQGAPGGFAAMVVTVRALLDLLVVAVVERVSPSDVAAAAPRTSGFLPSLARDAVLDTRFATRTLRQVPGFTAAVVVTLGLGFGALSGLFAVVDAVLLRPLPYPEAYRLVVVSSPYLDPDNAREWQAGQHVAERMASFTLGRATVQTPAGAAAVRTLPAGDGLLDLLGYQASTGRRFLPSDHNPGAPLVAMLSESFVKRWFAGVPPIGYGLELDGRVFDVIGVLPHDAMLRYRDLDVWLPIEQASGAGLSYLARLPAGLAASDAEAQLRPLAENLATPDKRQIVERFHARPVQVRNARDAVLLGIGGTLWLMFAVGGVVLLLALVNVGSLLLGRAVDRRDEMTVRMALGAGRGRLFRQMLIEAALLAALGAALGLGVARATPLVAGIAPDLVPRATGISIGWRTVLFTVLAAFGAVAVIGTLPGLAVGRTARATRVRTGLRDRASTRVQSVLAVAQIATALALVVGTALLVRTYYAVRPTDPGFTVANRAVLEMALPTDRYGEANAQRRFADRLMTSLRRVDGVRDVAIATDLPLTGVTMMEPVLRVDGTPPEGEQPPTIHIRAVSDGYHALMGMPIVAGRGLRASDARGAPAVVVVNQRAAERLWGESTRPVGRTLSVELGDSAVTATVVGIVRNAWVILGPDPEPEAFFAFTQVPFRRFSVVMATAPERSPVETDVRAALAAVDPRLPAQKYSSLSDAIGWIAALPRFQAAVFTILGALALMLAATGCFTVLSRLVLRRRAELGIRMALGARATDIVALVLRRAAVLATGGVLMGAGLALVGTRTLQSYLHGVTPADPPSFVAAALVLLLTIGVAALRPAWHAARTDPLKTLREE